MFHERYHVFYVSKDFGVDFGLSPGFEVWNIDVLPTFRNAL